MNRLQSFQQSIEELRTTKCSPERLHEFSAYLINRVNHSPCEPDHTVANDCLEYFNSLTDCTLHDLLEISYVLNGGVMLRECRGVSGDDSSSETVDNTCETCETDKVPCETDDIPSFLTTETHPEVHDNDSDIDFQNLVAELEGMSTQE